MKIKDIITVEPGKMGGVPCIRGLRIPVKTVARMLRQDYGDANILHDFPDLTQSDLDAVREWLERDDDAEPPRH